MLACAAAAVSAVTLAPSGIAAGDSSTPSYADRVLAREGLLAYWRLGETSGTTAADANDGRDGAYEGRVGLGAPGALNGDSDGAASFAGGRVNVPALPGGVDFTVEGWMRLRQGAATNNTLFGGARTLRLMPRPSGFYAGVSLKGVEYKLQGATPSNLGAWVHWALVRSGARLTLYRNGVAAASRANLPAAAVASLDADIGRTGSSYPAKGEIDEVAVYAAALGPAEVEEHYRAAAGPSPTYVDRASRGGACDDARTAAEAASAAKPWCTLERAAVAAPPGGTVLVRGATYPQTSIDDVGRDETLTFKPFASEAPVVDGLSIDDAAGFRFQGFRISDQTMLGRVTRIDLVGNDISPHGVHVRSGSDLLFEGNEIHDLTMDIDPATRHCIPPRCGYGVRIVHGNRLTFRDNLFSDVPGDGIQSGLAGDYAIEGNEFERIRPFVDPSEHSDAIQLYRGSDGVEIRGNYLHDTRGPLLGPGTGAADAHLNLVVENNTIVRQRDWGLKVHDAPGMVLANNTVWDAGAKGVSIGDTAAVTAATRDVRAFNNVVELLSASPSFFALEDYNLIGAGLRTGAHDLAGPPGFRDRASLDYGLSQSSPAVDAGISTGAPAKDRLGAGRVDQPAVPNTGGGAQPYYDMGALERR
jgi:hypothetical protein